MRMHPNARPHLEQELRIAREEGLNRLVVRSIIVDGISTAVKDYEAGNIDRSTLTRAVIELLGDETTLLETVRTGRA